MKLQAIKKRCLASGRFVIVNGPDREQWLYDGANYYAIIGIELRESNIPDVFDLTDKQMDKIFTDTINRRDSFFNGVAHRVGEELDEVWTIWAYDQKIVALRTADGLLYVPEDAILAACKRDDYASFTLVCDPEGKPMVAVSRGMFCDALLSPVTDDVADDISEKLRSVGSLPIIRTTIREEDEDEVAER